jgi:hypothetical protein
LSKHRTTNATKVAQREQAVLAHRVRQAEAQANAELLHKLDAIIQRNNRKRGVNAS